MASVVAGPGPDEAEGRGQTSECREVQNDSGRRSLRCSLVIGFTTSDGDQIEFSRSFGADLDEPIAVGASYTVYYDAEATHSPTREAVTEGERRVSIEGRLLGGAVIAGVAAVFWRRVRTGDWPFQAWFDRISSSDEDDESAG